MGFWSGGTPRMAHAMETRTKALAAVDAGRPYDQIAARRPRQSQAALRDWLACPAFRSASTSPEIEIV